MKRNNPIQTLMDEYDLISSTEGIINELDGKWLESTAKYTETVKKLLVFFKEYSNQIHHRKEEEILFKEMRVNPEFLLNDIIEELEEHHEMFQDTIKEIEEALENSDYEKVQSLFAGYINDLLGHIAVENDELFIMAESLFSEDKLERMYFLFQDIEMELGQDRKEELAEGLKALDNKVNIPVKRNKNLVTLSHEHHHGLVFCSRLKKANQADVNILKRFVKDFWDNRLSGHLSDEEDILLPYVWENEITAQFLSEHEQIRDLVKAIIEGNDSTKENSLKLGELINNHIRFEERTMFPWLENEVLTTEELSIVGKKLEGTEITAHHFTPEFWKNEN